MQRGGGVLVDRLLHLHRLHVPQAISALFAEDVIAGDQGDRDPEPTGQGGIEAQLTRRFLVEEHTEDVTAAHRVVQHAVTVAGGSVVADEHSGLCFVVYSLHHPQGFRAAHG